MVSPRRAPHRCACVVVGALAWALDAGGQGGGAAHGEGDEGDAGGLGGAEQAAVALGIMIATQGLGWAVDYGSARLKKKGYTKTSKVLWGVGCFLSVFVTLAKAYLMANRGEAIGDEAKGPAPLA